MKRIVSMAMVCALMLALTVCLTGCNTGEQEQKGEKPAVCFILGNTANSVGLNLNSPLVQHTIYNAVKTYGYVAVVSADGNSEVVITADFNLSDQYKNASSTMLESRANSESTALVAAMGNVIANDEEIDYLEALRMAVRSLSSLEGYDSKTIVVLGTGLSTTGVMDFRNNLLSADPEAVVELLEEGNNIPDMKNITSVVWQQLGDVSAPQQKLTQTQLMKLQAIWGGVVEAGGSTFIYNTIMGNPVNESVDYPSVSVVDLPEDTPISFSDETMKVTFEQPIVLPEEKLCFVSDSAEYLSTYEAVVETLRPIAEHMINTDPDMTLLLAGCIAGDKGSEAGYQLSMTRAESVKKTLVEEFGIPEERLITKGLGCSDPWHVSGAGYEGVLAAQNRKVVLMDASTELAREILKKH